MNKDLAVGIGSVVFLGLFVLGYWLTSPAPVAPAAAPIAIPAETSGQPLTQPPAANPTVQVSIATPTSGGTTASTTTATDPILSDPGIVADPINPGYYYLGYHLNQGTSTDATATSTPPYLITYISATHYFNIALLAEPIGEVRSQAEQYLAAHLGLTQDELCQLSYMVSVPDWVNTQYASRNLGFSFCSGATPLPN
jgi:hypothetical protein